MSSISTDRLQGVNVGAAVKVPCRLATTANITLSGLQTIDGVVTVQDDRVLVKNQTTSSQNGIYLADSGAWQRDKDWDGSYDVKKGTVVHVTEGSTYTRTWWEVTTSDPITPGTTGVTIIQGITDSAIITFLPSGTGGILGTVQGELRKTVFASDYALADGTNQQTGLANALTRASGGELIIDGVFRADTGALVIPAGTIIRFQGTNSKIDYRGTGACFEIRNSKNIAIYDPYIDLTNAGANAIGLWVRGSWFLDIYKPKVVLNAATHTGIQIESSMTGSLGYGAFFIEIFNPDLSGTGNYGIRTFQTSGDSVNPTHVNVYAGFSNGPTYGLFIRNVDGFLIKGFSAQVGTDGINIASSSNGVLSTGEMATTLTGYGINFGAGCSTMSVISPNLAGGGGALGYMNTATFTPQYFQQGKTRVYGSGTDQTFWAEMVSNFSYADSFWLQVNGGGTTVKLIDYDDANGARYQSVVGISGSPTLVSKNLRGRTTFTGAATKAVTFTNAEADSSYFVVLGGNVNETFWVTAKGTGGFTLNSSNAASVAVVDWHLFR